MLQQCRNIYQTLSKKVNQFDGYPLAEFDYPRRGCNVKIVEPQVPDEYYGTIVFADKYQIHIQIPGKMKAVKFVFSWCVREGQAERYLAEGYHIIDEKQINYVADEIYKAEMDWQESLSKSIKDRTPKEEPYRESYDAFVRKYINSRRAYKPVCGSSMACCLG